MRGCSTSRRGARGSRRSYQENGLPANNRGQSHLWPERRDLLADNQNLKLTVFRGGQVELVGFGIEGHGFRARKCLHGIHDGILIRPFLTDHSHGALAVRIEDELRFRIVSSS